MIFYYIKWKSCPSVSLSEFILMLINKTCVSSGVHKRFIIVDFCFVVNIFVIFILCRALMILEF